MSSIGQKLGVADYKLAPMCGSTINVTYVTLLRVALFPKHVTDAAV